MPLNVAPDDFGSLALESFSFRYSLDIKIDDESYFEMDLTPSSSKGLPNRIMSDSREFEFNFHVQSPESLADELFDEGHVLPQSPSSEPSSIAIDPEIEMEHPAPAASDTQLVETGECPVSNLDELKDEQEQEHEEDSNTKNHEDKPMAFCLVSSRPFKARTLLNKYLNIMRPVKYAMGLGSSRKARTQPTQNAVHPQVDPHIKSPAPSFTYSDDLIQEAVLHCKTPLNV